MPRLVFDLKPIGPWRGETIEEHNASLKELVADWSWSPAPEPCGCGMYVEGMLCTCQPQERRRKTPEDVRKALEYRARRDHLDALKKKREFPALPSCPLGVCYWCRQPIVHGRVKQRAMHDGRLDEPNCRHEYALRTRVETQRDYLSDRDGIGCFGCGCVVGRWARIWTCEDPARVEKYWSEGRYFRKCFPEMPGPLTWVRFEPSHEVDHFIALAVAFEAFPDPARRRWFFGPANIRLLCTDCHKAKTRQDRALLRECYAAGESFARARVLDRLAEAGLLKDARPKGPP